MTNDLTEVKNVRVDYSSLYESDMGKSISLNYNSTTGKYEGTFNVEKDDRDVKWVLTSIVVYDNQDNKYYFEGDPYYSYIEGDTYEYRDLSNYSINVYGTSFDDTPPTLNSFTVSAKEAAVGDKVKISADVTDDLTGVSSVNVLYRDPNESNWKSIDLNYNTTTGKYEGTFNVEKDDAEGEWKINSINLYDKKGNSYYKHHYIYDKDKDYKDYTGIDIGFDGYINEYRDLSNYHITIGSPPVTKIELQSSSPKVNEWYSSNVNVSLNATDDQSGVAKTLYKINNGDWNQYTNAFELQNEGIHTIEYKSIDKAGNEEEVKSEVVKIDKTAPTLNVSFDQSVITDRNHQLVPIIASVEADDNLSGVGSYELVSIVSNQQDNGKGDGNAAQDVQGAEFGTPDTNFLVRAERSSSGDRVYTVTYKATNNVGNTVTTSQDIVVKHDHSKK